MPYKDPVKARACKERSKLKWIARREAVGGCMSCAKNLAVPGKRRCQRCLDWLKDHGRDLLRGKSQSMVNNAKSRAAAAGLDFDLTLEWVRERVARGRCELTNLPFSSDPPSGSRCNPYAPSVDRIIPGGPYTKANCRIVVSALNLAMMDFGTEVFKVVAQAFMARN